MSLVKIETAEDILAQAAPAHVFHGETTSIVFGFHEGLHTIDIECACGLIFCLGADYLAALAFAEEARERERDRVAAITRNKKTKSRNQARSIRRRIVTPRGSSVTSKPRKRNAKVGKTRRKIRA